MLHLAFELHSNWNVVGETCEAWYEIEVNYVLLWLRGTKENKSDLFKDLKLLILILIDSLKLTILWSL
jgi:hypothetical protein